MHFRFVELEVAKDVVMLDVARRRLLEVKVAALLESLTSKVSRSTSGQNIARKKKPQNFRKDFSNDKKIAPSTTRHSR